MPSLLLAKRLPQWLNELFALRLESLHEPEAGTGQYAPVSELDREPLFETELLRMYGQRIWLVAALSVLLVPLFTTFYALISPATAGTVIKFQCAMAIVPIAIAITCSLVQKLSANRLMSLIGYALFSTGAAIVITVVSQNGLLNGDSNRTLQFTELASYIQLLLSILVMPYSLIESLVVVLLITGSAGWELYWTNTDTSPLTLAARAFVFGSTAFLVLCISHLQSVLRRRVFDSSFELAFQAARLHELTATDSLTGGFNRRHVEQLLAAELSRSARFFHPMALIMFDLDNFKPVNDTLGHAAGDEVLREVHQTASITVREVDTLARFGGDEFVIVLPETDAPAARIIAQRLRLEVIARLKSRFGPNSRASQVTVSMGVLTVSGREALSVEDVLGTADDLLYQAKRSGKNCIASSS